MQRFTLAATTLLLVSAFVVSLAGTSFGGEKDVTLKGTLFCILPGKVEKTVQTIVSDGPCDRLEPHSHVLLVQRGMEGYVYAVQGSKEAITKIEKSTGDRKNFELKGKIGGNQRAWTITVD